MEQIKKSRTQTNFTSLYRSKMDQFRRGCISLGITYIKADTFDGYTSIFADLAPDDKQKLVTAAANIGSIEWD